MTNELLKDIDPAETADWLGALDAVLASEGEARAAFLLSELLARANQSGVATQLPLTTNYRNTIRTPDEKPLPPDEGMAKRVAALIRWNAVAMVLLLALRVPKWQAAPN